MVCVAAGAAQQAPAPKPPPPPAPTGYKDTPKQMYGKWLIHDDDRPRPAVVTPGPFVGLPAPTDAIVLLGAGQDLSQWQMTEGGGAVTWPIADGVLSSGRGMIRTKRDDFTDYQLHVEFATPTEVKGNSQGRGNSGVFLNGVFEIQVLDSYDNKSYADGQASAMYGQIPPMVNASRPPGQWQSYDIAFRGPRFNGTTLEKKAIVTVLCTTGSSSTPPTSSGARPRTSSIRPTSRRTPRASSSCRITGIRSASGISGFGRSRTPNRGADRRGRDGIPARVAGLLCNPSAACPSRGA